MVVPRNLRVPALLVAVASLVLLESHAQTMSDPRSAASFQTTVIQSSVSQYLLTPDGYVDGLLLANNAIIRFPPHLGQVLTQTVIPEDVVRVEGFFESAGIFHASSIINLQTQRALIDTPPSPKRPPLPAPGSVARQPLSASGTIRVLTHNKLGEIDGVILSDGAIVHFPPSVGARFGTWLREGNGFAATGNGISNQYGRSFEATAIGPSSAQLEAIVLEPGPEPTANPEP